MARKEQKIREQQVAESFLQKYNKETGKNFEVKSRPEEDYSTPESFDFLCADIVSGEEIALEIAELQESQARRESDEVLGRLLDKIEDTLEGQVKGTFVLIANGPVSFKKEDFNTLVNLIKEHSSHLQKGSTISIREPIPFKLKKISDDGSTVGSLYGYEYNGNSVIDIQRVIDRFISEIVPKKNKQLASAGNRKTILLLDNRPRYNFFAKPRCIARALEKLDPADYSSIDHIYLIDGDGQAQEIEFNRSQEES